LAKRLIEEELIRKEEEMLQKVLRESLHEYSQQMSVINDEQERMIKESAGG
jgi:hypothetical protein